jgi:dihydroorotase
MTQKQAEQLRIITPFDAHLHLRDGDKMLHVTPYSADQFSDVVVMPNLIPPVTTVNQALLYQQDLQNVIKNQIYDYSCNFHMALYLTKTTTLKDIELAANNSNIIGFKLYPANATTNSADGIADIESSFDQLEKMEELGVTLMVHGEVTDSYVDIFDREKVFIDTILQKIVSRFPKLKVSLEHITTKDSVQFVSEANENVVASITAHHLLVNRNDMLVGGIRPHYFCLPILKRREHQEALIQAASSGNSKFFLGTDSAPHLKEDKESACGCAGSFTAPYAMELYANAFEQANSLDKLENFSSVFGRQFHGLNIPETTILLQKQENVIVNNIADIVPFWNDENVGWKFIRD